MVKFRTSCTASRVLFCVWIVCAMSLLSGKWFLRNVSGHPSPGSPSGCQLQNTSLGTKATCTHLNLNDVPQDLPNNTVVLDLSYNKITELYNSSFAYLPNITILALGYNVLSKIENGAFRPLAHLRTLMLLNNRLVSLPDGLFGFNHLLSRLILSTNKFRSIPSNTLPWVNSITLLDMRKNNISLINPYDFKPLKNCSLLGVLLGNNALSYLPSHLCLYLQKVQKLELHSNPLHEFHISSVLGNAVIGLLNLQNCKIKAIIPLKSCCVFVGSSQINKVNLAQNMISSLPEFAFWGLNHTKNLVLQFNNIYNISNRSFCGLDQLNELDLSQNRMTFLSLNAFSCNKMLHLLKIRHNHIMAFSAGVSSGHSMLHHLDLAHNDIKDVPGSNTSITRSLEYLDLSSNKIVAIKKYFFQGFTNLKVLKMSDNDITGLYSPKSFTELKNLRELYLMRDGIPQPNEAFRYMDKLYLLDLSFASLRMKSKTQFTNTSSLETLIMREDRLKSVDLFDSETNTSLFLGLKSLIKLDLRGNQLDMLATGTFHPLQKLKILTLSKSSIKILELGVFDSLVTLTTLDLRDNEITKIPAGLLQTQHQLAVLQLSNNKLQSIPRTLFNGTSLHTLYIQENKITRIEPKTMFPTNRTLNLDAFGNPFSCTCHLTWFVKLLHSGNIELRHPNKTRCSLTSIKEKVNSPILSFNPDQYCGINIVMITCVSFSVFLVGVVCLVAYRKRWWLNYKVFLLKLAIFGYEEINQDFDAQDYEYQLNIMYHEDDQEWVDQIMKPILQERFPHLQKVVFGDNDLNLGMFYINALHYAVDNSFKTVLLISYNSVDDAWFLTKLRIALENLNDTRLDKVILIFLEDIHDENLPYLVRLFLSKNKPYMLWTEDEDGQELFWAQFDKSMRTNRALNSVIPI